GFRDALLSAWKVLDSWLVVLLRLWHGGKASARYDHSVRRCAYTPRRSVAFASTRTRGMAAHDPIDSGAHIDQLPNGVQPPFSICFADPPLWIHLGLPACPTSSGIQVCAPRRPFRWRPCCDSRQQLKRLSAQRV